MPSNSNPEISIVVPTYREAENLPELFARLSAAMKSDSLNAEIIVVDDNSPDGTVEVCREADRSDLPIRLLVRKNQRGLSSAVVAGLRQARGDYLIVMDADLSHPPERIADLIAGLRDGSDFVIGSRYVAGGSTSADWGFLRLLNSKIATWLARPLTIAQDPMAGFFALSAETYREAATDLEPIGYKIGLELMVKGHCVAVSEKPIHFEDRRQGESKLNLREQLNYLRHLSRLYQYKYGLTSTAARFSLVGLSGVFVDVAAFSLVSTVATIPVARALAIGVAMTWNFQWNRHFTFAHCGPKTNWANQFARYASTCMLGAVLNWMISVVMVSRFGLTPMSGALTGILLASVSNFLLCRSFVFRTTQPPSTVQPQATSRIAPAATATSRVPAKRRAA